MDKLKMQSMDKIQANIDAILKIFPDVATEAKDAQGGAKITNKIDFEKLKQHLVNYIVDDSQERYQFTWPDKRKAILTANTPINKTLRPNKSESVDFDTTQNLYIEGDNLEVLKLLQYTYLNKIKMIYIDPPYNTGKDFIYPDNYYQDKDEYIENSGQTNDEGSRLVQNLETNGRFHTDWLNMMYPRLMLAKNLLSEDGVIFISIDDNEVANLRKICDEIFGENNLINIICVKMSESSGVKMAHSNKRLPKLKEYILAYQKSTIEINPIKINKSKWDTEYKSILENISDEELDMLKNILIKNTFNENDLKIAAQMVSKLSYRNLKEIYKEKNLRTKKEQLSFNYANANRIFQTCALPENTYKILNQKKKEQLNTFFIYRTPKNLLYLIKGDYNIEQKKPRAQVVFASEHLTINPGDFWYDIKTTGIEAEGNISFKNGKKPLSLLNRLLKISKNKNDIILDFFSGSATTAHTVMQLNAEDGGNRKFIMVQIPEKTDEKSEAFKAGYPNICEIGKERIRRAGARIRKDIEASIAAAQSSLDKLKQEQGKKASLFDDDEFKQKMAGFEETIDSQGERLKTLDTGFRVFKVDSSNMNDVYYTPDKIDPQALDNLLDNIKSDRSPEDLLFQVMLDLGIYLSSEIKVDIIAGKKVFNVEKNYLIACFDQGVTCDVVEAIAKKHPQYAVFRDSSFADDNVATNIKQIFKLYAPNTTFKTL